LPAETTTPLSLSLPPGTYQVAVVGPPPESQMQRVSVRVDPNATNVASLLRFHAITAEEYFEQYLTSSSGSSVVDGGATSSVPPAETDGAAAPSAPALSFPASSTGAQR
jgi:hypothetical protein